MEWPQGNSTNSLDWLQTCHDSIYHPTRLASAEDYQLNPGGLKPPMVSSPSKTALQLRQKTPFLNVWEMSPAKKLPANTLQSDLRYWHLYNIMPTGTYRGWMKKTSFSFVAQWSWRKCGGMRNTPDIFEAKPAFYGICINAGREGQNNFQKFTNQGKGTSEKRIKMRHNNNLIKVGSEFST